MDETYSDQIENATTPEQRPPRARCIIEFVEGDLNKPVVYPIGGSEETDEAIRQEIQRRWGLGE